MDHMKIRKAKIRTFDLINATKKVMFCHVWATILRYKTTHTDSSREKVKAWCKGLLRDLWITLELFLMQLLGMNGALCVKCD